MGEATPLDQKSILNGKSFKYRWVILLLNSLLFAASQMVWLTYVSIASQVRTAYGISSLQINMTSLIYSIVYILFTFPSVWVIERYGVRVGGGIAAVATLFGAWFRLFGKYHYGWLILGQGIAGIGSPFIQNSIAQFSAEWFPERQRVLATGLACSSNLIGSAIGFLLPGLVVTDSDSLLVLLLIEGGICSVISVLYLIFYRDRKNYSPETWDESMQAKRTNFKKSIKNCLLDRNLWVIMALSGISQGVFNTAATVLTQVLNQLGYTDLESSVLGGIVIIFGLIGCIVIGPIVDRTKSYKISLIVCLFVATVSLSIFSGILAPQRIIPLGVAASFLGLFTTPTVPLSLDLGAEISHPDPESVSSGLIISFGALLTIVFTLIVNRILEDSKTVVASIVLSVLMGVSFLFSIVVKQDLKRYEEEKMKNK